jgi:hypothetical protein
VPSHPPSGLDEGPDKPALDAGGDLDVDCVVPRAAMPVLCMRRRDIDDVTPCWSKALAGLRGYGPRRPQASKQDYRCVAAANSHGRIRHGLPT